MNNHIFNYFSLIPDLIKKIDMKKIDKVINYLISVKKKEEEFFFLALEAVLEIALMQSMIFVKFVKLKVTPQLITYLN